MSSTNLSRRVLPLRWTPNAFRRGPELLSFDVFGFAFASWLLRPSDVHRLVGGLLERRSQVPVARYLEARARAEDDARQAARIEGRASIAAADITETLAPRLAEVVGSNDDADGLARAAIKAELEYTQMAVRANPEATALYREALDRQIKVAFLADSHLPRDLVARMLQQAGYRQGLVLVSSHDGETKRTGGLFTVLAARSGVECGRITHIGPDQAADVERPGEVGVTGILRSGHRMTGIDDIELGLTPQTGIDSLGLAMAADHYVDARHELRPANLGYYATGPLLAGFCSWVARQVDDAHATALFCGPSARLLREVTMTLRPDLPPTMFQAVRSWQPGVPERSSVEGALDRIPTDRSMVAVDLGWGPGAPHHWLPELLTGLGRPADVSYAYLAPGDDAAPEPGRSAWSFGPDVPRLFELGRTVSTVLQAIVPADDPIAKGPYGEETYRRYQPSVATTAVRFAEDFHQWLRIDPRATTAALAEPALRVATSPRPAEADFLGRYRIPGRTDDDDRPIALLPPLSELSQNPLAANRAAGRSPWPAGYHALAEGESALATSARRFKLGFGSRRLRDWAS